MKTSKTGKLSLQTVKNTVIERMLTEKRSDCFIENFQKLSKKRM